jgi:hypothetical protein
VTVATLLTLISILGGLGTLAKNIVDIRAALEKEPAGAPAAPEHIAAIKAAMGSGGSVWDETHQGE